MSSITCSKADCDVEKTGCARYIGSGIEDTYCYSDKCEYYNNNREGCLDNSEYCYWIEGEDVGNIKPEKEMSTLLFCDWNCDEDETCNNGICEDLGSRSCSGEPITPCEDFDEETCRKDNYQRQCVWFTMTYDDGIVEEYCRQGSCDGLTISKTACTKHGCEFS
ncbi:MAG: hypothetical protein ABFQ65_01875 [Nanoarchaeota archaeon]